MRSVTLITVMAVAGAAFLGSNQGLDSLKEKVPFLRDVSETEAALEVRCGELEPWERRSCENELVERFAAGRANPTSVLRLHCTLVPNVWEQSISQPPPLCAARFGGWLSS
jgi:hypothetical protein